MKIDANVNLNTGTMFSSLLVIVFITLKLCGVINWSWIWVLAPLWVPLLLSIVFIAILFSVMLLVVIFKKD